MAKELVPGLAGIPAAESAISYIDGGAGILKYRGFPIEVLAERSTFEETTWLLLHGALPTRAELDGFRALLGESRSLPPDVVEAVSRLPRGGHPMHALQAAVALLGMHSEQDFGTPEAREAACVKLIATLPTLVATFDRARRGLEPVAPDPSLDTAANFLWMVNGERPDELAARILDVALILHADHTMNASTFATRVVGSTEADPFGVVVSGLAALSGPLHGGANERVLQQLERIGSAEAVPAWLQERLAAKGKVMGFGHRVYKVKDPRAFCLQGLVRQLFAKLGTTPIYDIALRLEEEVVKHLGDKGIHPNVDFYSGIVYQKLGIATDLFTPVFAIARVSGWLAHWLEQMRDNRIFRPTQIYVGADESEYTAIEDR